MHKFCSLSLSLEFIISILGLGIFDEVSVSSRSFNQVSVLKVTVSTASLCASHRCSGRQIFGGAKDFCPNSPKLARKKLKKVTSKNKLCMCFWEPFFQIKEGWAPFAHIFRGLLRFSRILRRFSAILLGFMECSSDFYQIKTLGVLLHTLHPSLLHHWCECHRVAVKQRMYAAAVADTQGCLLKLAIAQALFTRNYAKIENVHQIRKKTFVFIMWRLYVQLLGAEQIRACDQYTWTAN